jgi:hypothetical protein
MFNHQYYYFVTALPDISFDSPKLPFSVEEFRTMLDDTLHPKDKALVDSYFLKYDNENLVAFLKDYNATLSAKGTLTVEELKDIVENDLYPSGKKAPRYLSDFVDLWLKENGESKNQLWEELMTSYYMDYGMQSNSSLIAKWFELNLNIGNILSAIYCRKYNMPIAEAIVGNNDVAEAIRKNANARDFGLGTNVDYFEKIVNITKDPDIYEREHRIDKLRWNWLEANTAFNLFNIEYIFAYLCKLQILERWISLNAEEGERVFRKLIAELKSEVEVPAE